MMPASYEQLLRCYQSVRLIAKCVRAKPCRSSVASSRLPTAAALLRARASHAGSVVARSALGHDCSKSFGFPHNFRYMTPHALGYMGHTLSRFLAFRVSTLQMPIIAYSNSRLCYLIPPATPSCTSWTGLLPARLSST
jgi:hypothetical protein